MLWAPLGPWRAATRRPGAVRLDAAHARRGGWVGGVGVRRAHRGAAVLREAVVACADVRVLVGGTAAVRAADALAVLKGVPPEAAVLVARRPGVWGFGVEVGRSHVTGVRPGGGGRG